MSKAWSRSVMPCISEAVGAVCVLVLIGRGTDVFLERMNAAEVMLCRETSG